MLMVAAQVPSGDGIFRVRVSPLSDASRQVHVDMFLAIVDGAQSAFVDICARLEERLVQWAEDLDTSAIRLPQHTGQGIQWLISEQRTATGA
jgi:hypothetical protein